jgi:hypothetical protein
MNKPLFQSRRAKGITPDRLPFGHEEEGRYVKTALPDLLPTTSGPRTHKGERQYLESCWGGIEFLPESNHEFLLDVLAAAKEFRQAHTGRSGFATEFHYLPKPPYPLWTKHLPYPEYSDFEKLLPVLGDSRVDGGFVFVDTHSFWDIYGQHIPGCGLTFLCLYPHHFRPSPAFLQAIRDLTHDHGLCLVDWGRLCIVRTDVPREFEEWTFIYT